MLRPFVRHRFERLQLAEVECIRSPSPKTRIAPWKAGPDDLAIVVSDHGPDRLIIGIYLYKLGLANPLPWCILYTVRRTQLYIEDELWKALHVRARQSKSTVSELVRKALHEKYLGDAAGRKEALLSAVGLWKDRTDLSDTQTYIRSLRKGTRLQRISQ